MVDHIRTTRLVRGAMEHAGNQSGIHSIRLVVVLTANTPSPRAPTSVRWGKDPRQRDDHLSGNAGIHSRQARHGDPELAVPGRNGQPRTWSFSSGRATTRP